MNLWEPPAGFDQPLAALAACHRRIEKQMATLARLPKHIARNGVDAEARLAISGILRYFLDAAPNHHADEEQTCSAPAARGGAGRSCPVVRTGIPPAGRSSRHGSRLMQVNEALAAAVRCQPLDTQLCKDFRASMPAISSARNRC
jgi:hypothetical protein